MPRVPVPSAVLLVLLAAPAYAQGPITTDRPGFAFNPAVVPVGALQVEVGTPQVARSGGGGGSFALVNAPTTLRFGLARGVEVRAFSALYNTARAAVPGGDDRTAGFGDVEVGVKVQLLTAGPGGTAALAFIPTVVLPTGRAGFTAGGPVVNANVAAGFALPSALALTVLVGAAVPTADGADPTGSLVLALGRALAPAVSGYVEGAYFPSEDAGPLYVGAGAAFLVSPTAQIDAFFDLGLNDEAFDVVGGIGVSARFGR